MSGNSSHNPSLPSRFAAITHSLYRPVDIAFLVFFRVILGLFLCWHAWRYISRGWIEDLYITPEFLFTYYGFEWVHPLPGGAVYIQFLGLATLAIAVAAGFYYRGASVLLCLVFWHQFLMEQTRYQNHYYLLGLLAFLMICIPADRAGSLDVLRLPQLRSRTVPAWTLWLLRFQIGIAYVFGGIAKLNGDWLHGEPVRMWLASQTEQPFIGPYVTEEWMVMLVAYGGLLIDLFIVPLLLWRRTRGVAYAIAVLFHLLNAALFRIGIFPWFMIAATTVFFSPGWPRKLWRPQEGRRAFGPIPSDSLTLRQRMTLAALGIYVTIQLLLPLRHFLYPGKVDWTEEGGRFAWRMMLRDKRVLLRFVVTNPDSNQSHVIDPREYLTPRQAGRFGLDPDQILQFSHYLAGQLSQDGKSVEVRVVAIASLNGREPQLLIDPTLNLAEVPRTLEPKAWIRPLIRPLPEKRWEGSVIEWENAVDLPPELSYQELSKVK